MTTTQTRLLTADDLLRLDSEGVRGELIRGVLCETMSAGQRHGKIVVNLVMELGVFVKAGRLGTLVASDSGVWLERDPDTVREPDIAFTSVDRLPLGEDLPGYAEVSPDLVVEIVSPSDSRRAVHDKAQMWLRQRRAPRLGRPPGHAHSRRAPRKRRVRNARRARLAQRDGCAARLQLPGERRLRRLGRPARNNSSPAPRGELSDRGAPPSETCA